MLVIGHRGANKEALENSWTAFTKAIEGGAERIELDVQLSRDGHAVVMHDDDMRRTTDKAWLISEHTRPELAGVTLRNGDPLPFLDEVIARILPLCELNIEIKGESELLAAEVARLVAEHPLRRRVIVSCFEIKPLAWIKNHAPAVQRACLWPPDRFIWPYFAIMAPQVFLDQAGTQILHPHVSMVDANLMDQAQARGWQVFAWVEMLGEDHDREGLWTAMKTFGLHGLCTNYPRELHAWLKEGALYDQHFSAESRTY